MSEIMAKGPMKEASGMRRIGLGSSPSFVALVVLALFFPYYASAGTVTETFDGFTCPGAWVQDPSGPNTSYMRDCGNGWTAYAEDTRNPNINPPIAGNIGNLNTVDSDAVNGPSAAPSTPLASALLSTAPGGPIPRGVLWLLKSYPVEAGVPIQTVQADARINISGSTSMKYGIVVFNGVVTNPSGATSSITGLPLATVRSDVLAGQVVASGVSTDVGAACSGVAPGQWCAWQTLNAGSQYVVPTSSYITVGFRVVDSATDQISSGEVDNLTISGVVTTGNPSIPPNGLAQLWAETNQASGSNNMAQSADIVVDGAGNSYVTGSTYNSQNYDIFTIK